MVGYNGLSQQIAAMDQSWLSIDIVTRGKMACEAFNITDKAAPAAVAAAMQKMPFWAQGSKNYLDMVKALCAAGHPLFVDNRS